MVEKSYYGLWIAIQPCQDKIQQAASRMMPLRMGTVHVSVLRNGVKKEGFKPGGWQSHVNFSWLNAALFG